MSCMQSVVSCLCLVNCAVHAYLVIDCQKFYTMSHHACMVVSPQSTTSYLRTFKFKILILCMHGILYKLFIIKLWIIMHSLSIMEHYHTLHGSYLCNIIRTSKGKLLTIQGCGLVIEMACYIKQVIIHLYEYVAITLIHR